MRCERAYSIWNNVKVAHGHMQPVACDHWLIIAGVRGISRIRDRAEMLQISSLLSENVTELRQNINILNCDKFSIIDIISTIIRFVLMLCNVVIDLHYN
jgi:hypothetical protein